MKILLTGASGLLGTACNTFFVAQGLEVETLSRDQVWAIVHQRCSIEFAPRQVLIHAAANTNVEQCELEPDACYRDNYLLTAGLADACAVARIPMVFISSTGVYGAEQNEPYREYSNAHPTTHHHRAKWLGEQSVLSAGKKNLVIRTGWLFGGDFANPKNFVARRLEEATRSAANGEPLFSNAEQRGCPTYTKDVVNRLFTLIMDGHNGIFNLVNEGTASRLDYVRAIVSNAGLAVPVEAATAAIFKRNARVSFNEMAINWRATALGFPSMPSWRDSLNKYISENFFDL
jgi:dTDP-4-dehydrorhamnose reductase